MGTLLAAALETRTWPWVVMEAFAVALFVTSGVLWQKARTGVRAPELVSRYRVGMQGAAFWAALIAVRLIAHAY